MNGTVPGVGMNTEETTVDLKDAEAGDDEPQPAAVPAPLAPDADATEADVSEADLDQEEQEKQPMTGGGDRAEDAPAAGGEQAAAAAAEKNGSVKLKIGEEEEEDREEVKFTGLNKEELMRVAGTPGWVRTRWALLVVFWLGWLGMLVGAVLLILQAPRCKGEPAVNWWNEGPLYQIGNVRAFSDAGDLKGVEQRIGSLSQMKVQGLVLGPVHEAPADQVNDLRFEEVSADSGSLDQFRSLVKAAHGKGISVVLDLTPNYLGSSGPWFSNSSVTSVAERLKSALVFWMNEGVDGVQLSGVERVAGAVPSLWTDIRAIVQNGTELRSKKRVLIGVTERSAAEDVSALLDSTGVDLLISRVLVPGGAGGADAAERARSVQLLYSSHNQTELAWSLGGRSEGHLASLVGPALVRPHLLLLLTLPGTPVFNYGDEIGLMDEGNTFPRMLWDSDGELNETQQEERAERQSCLRFFSALSDLRGKERSLRFGDFLLLSNSSSSLAYLRVWDQSQRFLAAFNWADEAAVLQLSGAALPRRAAVVLATDGGVPPTDGDADLTELRLGPGQAALLRFPFAG